MTMLLPDYRARADRCMELARNAKNESNKTRWLKAAETWMQAAAAADLRAREAEDDKPAAPTEETEPTEKTETYEV